jgi:flagellar basal-body rod protein FlgB
MKASSVMIKSINASLEFQAAALKLRARRQEVLAANIANADTPNYKAQDFDFSTALARAVSPAAGDTSIATVLRSRSGAVAGLDGNTVDLDIERVQFADNAVRYEAALRFINGKLKTLLSAIQG